MPGPTARRSDSTAPAASIEPAPRHARWRTIAPMPTTAPSSITQPSSIAAWPTITSSPTTVGRSFAQWITALSCTEVPAPMVMFELSPRSTAPNQMLARSPTRTSPTSTAVGATQTASPIVGRTPPSSTITAIGCRPRCLTACAQHYTVSPVSQVSYVRRRPMTTAPIEELARRTEEEVREHLAAGRLVEGLQHMSPEYLRGIRRILTVSADTELVSAPAYLRAAQHAPALNNFGSAVSICQDELAHAHIGYRLL